MPRALGSCAGEVGTTMTGSVGSPPPLSLPSGPNGMNASTAISTKSRAPKISRPLFGPRPEVSPPSSPGKGGNAEPSSGGGFTESRHRRPTVADRVVSGAGSSLRRRLGIGLSSGSSAAGVRRLLPGALTPRRAPGGVAGLLSNSRCRRSRSSRSRSLLQRDSSDGRNRLHIDTPRVSRAGVSAAGERVHGDGGSIGVGCQVR